MKNLVTGGTGHIGNVLIRELVQRKEHVRVMVLPKDDLTPLINLDVEIVLGNILEPETIRKAMKGIDRVFHLAGMISILPGQQKLLSAINVSGTKNMLDCALEANVGQFIYTSSIHALAGVPHGEVITEKCPFDPEKSVGDYDKSKALASLLVLKAANEGLNAVIVCPTGVIGPHDYRGSEMGTYLWNSTKTRLVVGVHGAYDFVDVRDVAEGILLASEHGIAGNAYILSGEQISIKNIVHEVKGAVGQQFRMLFVPRWLAKFSAQIMPFFYELTRQKPQFTPYSIKTVFSNSVVSHAKATVELGYHPRKVRVSIRDTIHWFENNQ